MKNTPEQAAILAAAKGSREPLLINSGPGTGKTSTIVMLAHEMPPEPILSLAFNKAIATEMQQRMPSHVKASTLNGAGHAALRSLIGRNPAIDTKKTFNIAVALFGDRKFSNSEERSQFFSTFIRAIGIAKSQGYVPPDWTSIGKGLVTWDELKLTLERECDDPPDKDDLDEGLSASIKAAYSGTCDFDDQIYLPTLFGGVFPRYPTILGDEAQDFSPLNHAMLQRMDCGRLIAVGDPFQSIYGFRGAMQNSMTTLQESFGMKDLPLNTSFRVPILGVKRAQKRNPALMWHENAKQGFVRWLEFWDTNDVPEGAAIICRNNAPLMRVALGMIKKGRAVQMAGRDIGPGLIKILQKLGPSHMTRNALYKAIEDWEKEQIRKTKPARHAIIYDKVECLRVFAQVGSTLGEAIAFAEHLFSPSNGTVRLMSGHKAKGLEFETVFHLDPWRIPSKWAKKAALAGDNTLMEQELNVNYVIETRFKENLFLVDTERFEDA